MDDIIKELGFGASVGTGVPALDSLWQDVEYLLGTADVRGFYARLPYDLNIH